MLIFFLQNKKGGEKMVRRMVLCLLIAVIFIMPISAIKNDGVSIIEQEDINRNSSAIVPDLVYYPTSHDFGYVEEGKTYQTTFDIWNGGTGTLTWSLGIVHTWISPFPTSGSSTGEHDTVTVTIDTTGLSPGSYSGFVSISANDGGGLRYFNVYCVVNAEPNIPSTPSGPSSGETGIYYTYFTSTTDPEGDDIRYGWDLNQDSIVDYWSSSYYSSGTTYSLNIKFGSAGTHHLRVKAEDVHGAQSAFSSAKTVVISGANNAPNTPSMPSGPTSGSPDTSYTYLTNATDPDGDQVKYGWDWDGDGTVDEWSGLHTSGATCSVSHSWSSAGIYQVKVKAQDEYGAESGWSAALTVTISTNVAPDKPARPSGPTSGKAGTSYTYSSSATDPNGDKVYIMFDWDDGANSGWMGPFTSGDTVTASHVWSAQGTYSIKVKAKDVYGEESMWSEPLSISMPKTFGVWNILEKLNEWLIITLGKVVMSFFAV